MFLLWEYQVSVLLILGKDIDWSLEVSNLFLLTGVFAPHFPKLASLPLSYVINGWSCTYTCECS